MANSKILNTILKDTFTLHQLQKRVGILKEVLKKQLFTESSNFSLEKIITDPDDRQWLDSLDKGILSAFNRENMQVLLSNLDAEIKNLNPLTIYIPLDLPENELAELKIRLRKTYGEDFIFDVKLDPNLIAGCALVWKGIYKDYSLRKKISDSREQILAILKSSIK